MPNRTVIERGPKGKRAVAFSIDWPGPLSSATTNGLPEGLDTDPEEGHSTRGTALIA